MSSGRKEHNFWWTEKTAAPTLTLFKYKPIMLRFKMKPTQHLHPLTCMLHEVKVSKTTSNKKIDLPKRTGYVLERRRRSPIWNTQFKGEKKMCLGEIWNNDAHWPEVRNKELNWRRRNRGEATAHVSPECSNSYVLLGTIFTEATTTMQIMSVCPFAYSKFDVSLTDFSKIW